MAEGTYGGVSAVSNVDEKWGPIRGVEPFGSAFGRPALKIGSCSLACTSVAQHAQFDDVQRKANIDD